MLEKIVALWYLLNQGKYFLYEKHDNHFSP